MPELTVAENIYLGNMSEANGVINRRKLNKKAEEIIKNIGIDISPKSFVKDLSVAYQQVVEIAKALSENSRILILDEPTAVLAPQDVGNLFKILFKLRTKA